MGLDTNYLSLLSKSYIDNDALKLVFIGRITHNLKNVELSLAIENQQPIKNITSSDLVDRRSSKPPRIIDKDAEIIYDVNNIDTYKILKKKYLDCILDNFPENGSYI